MSNQREKHHTFSESALQILESRYLRRDESGKVIESPDDMFRRVARVVVQAESQYTKKYHAVEEQFYEVMASMNFLPNSPTLMNAGTGLGQLSACFVVPLEDSLVSILKTAKTMGLIHKSGGGTGISLSPLRPAGDMVQSTKGVASGPVSFLRLFNTTTSVVKQGGKRRGANIALLDVHHPDIVEFIRAKTVEGRLDCFNLSVTVSDSFMHDVENDSSYQLFNPRTRKKVKSVRARRIFDLIVDASWESGEPGICFLDRINEANPTPSLGRIHATNPCGEQPLYPMESCNLGSINLAKMVSGKQIDYEKIDSTVRTAVRFLDDVIDVNEYPLPEIETATKSNRKIGLGVMGWADLLLKLDIPYASEEAVELAGEVMKRITHVARRTSAMLGKKKGSFPNFQKSVWPSRGFKSMRNATVTTIAPTGSISILAECSSGIEPIFAVAYKKALSDGTSVSYINPLFREIAKREGFYDEKTKNQILKMGSVAQVMVSPSRTHNLFKTAHEIEPKWHVRMQAFFQKHTDNAVSKTVNLPSSATREDVRQIFLKAWKLGCKGITVFRDGCRNTQVLTAGLSSPLHQPINVQPRLRLKTTHGVTTKHRVGCGNLYISINRDNQGLCEVFTNTGRGGCPCQSEGMSRLLSIALRAGVPPEILAEQLTGIRCLATITAAKTNPEIEVLSCPDAIGSAIRETVGGDSSSNKITEKCATCPQCRRPLEYDGARCLVCRNCGFSSCGDS